MGWRDDPITEKQEEFIAEIEQNAVESGAFVAPFHGKTKGEASDWIGAYISLQSYSVYNPHKDAGDRD